MKVALVSSLGRCGIAEHSLMLQQSVLQTDRSIEFLVKSSWLDPADYAADPYQADILHLNYHRGLHSQWTPERLAACRKQAKVVVTFHDTYETQPDRLPWELLQVADAMVVHEPCDLQQEYVPTLNRDRHKVHYWRQGVPEPDLHSVGTWSRHIFCRPIVGTCGFAFPWKGFELLCEAAASVGWGVTILSHNATAAQIAEWGRLNPWLQVETTYLPTARMVAMLGQCDATAFLYSCANSGTSGAIRLGIAAGKPLLATRGCRQFRDLADDFRVIWTDPDVGNVADVLKTLDCGRFDTGIVALRERDSWRHLGQKYAALYRSLVQP